jgi:hypothetical protein
LFAKRFTTIETESAILSQLIFPENLKNKILFSNAIDLIPSQFHSSDNYIWLKSFKDGNYRKLNELRKRIVHYFTTDTDYRHTHLLAIERSDMEKLQSEREGLPNYYKLELQRTIEGFERTLFLLEEIGLVDVQKS